MAISAYILKIVEKDPFLGLQMRAKSSPIFFPQISNPKDYAGGSKKTFYFQSANKYNKLPVDIKDTNSILTFRNSMRNHFFIIHSMVVPIFNDVLSDCSVFRAQFYYGQFYLFI